MSSRYNENLSGVTLKCEYCGRLATFDYGRRVGFQKAAFDRHEDTCKDIARVASEHGISHDEARKLRRRLRRKNLDASESHQYYKRLARRRRGFDG